MDVLRPSKSVIPAPTVALVSRSIRIGAADSLENSLIKSNEIHDAVAESLWKQPLAGIDGQDSRLGCRCSRHHVAGVLFVTPVCRQR
jgi:hypothetical protein